MERNGNNREIWLKYYQLREVNDGGIIICEQIKSKNQCYLKARFDIIE